MTARTVRYMLRLRGDPAVLASLPDASWIDVLAGDHSVRGRLTVLEAAQLYPERNHPRRTSRERRSTE